MDRALFPYVDRLCRCAAERNGEHADRVRAKCHDERRLAAISTTSLGITVDVLR